MGETRWTPGPWDINEDNRPGMSWNREIIYGDGENRICFMAHSDGRAPEQDEANACLIAAAPDLYAALDRLIARYHPYRDNQEDSDWVAAVAALAKARGGTP